VERKRAIKRLPEMPEAPESLSGITILGYRISNAGLRADVERAWELIGSGPCGSYIACANPHSLVLTSKDPLFERALKEATILLPDGSGIMLAAKVLGLPIRERVAGYEFFTALSEKAEGNGGLSYFFLGSSEDVLRRIKSRLSVDFPGVRICGFYAPPFEVEFPDEENCRMIEMINAARPDVLWVGMTAPKQEKWIYQNREKINVPLIGAIGAVFDYYAGVKKRPSLLLRRLGLEFAGRFIREPMRLWHRNFVSTPVFLGWIARERVRLNRSPQARRAVGKDGCV
jgi:N-acetylglucosaminyldiphosphoundecaprenol N-acetyl-beta-D-mannosaminyltransferase